MYHVKKLFLALLSFTLCLFAGRVVVSGQSLGCSEVRFNVSPTFTTGGNPVSLAAGDFNGDGELDLASGNGVNVIVLLGSGGGFSPPKSFKAGSKPQGVTTADFNGDGRLDLAAANFNSGNVSVLLGAGDGTFAAPVNYTTGAAPTAVAAGDFNGDGKPDLVVTNANSQNVSILLNNGAGSFTGPVNFPAGFLPSDVDVADFNGDGKADLAVGASGAWVLLGHGDGTFGAATQVSPGLNTSQLAIGDLNGDGKADIAFPNNSSGGASVLYGTGTGSFAAATNYAIGGPTGRVTIADLNGDGKLDLAVGSGIVRVLLADGKGGFVASGDYAPGGDSEIVAADYNHDGVIDLASANSSAGEVSLMRGLGGGAFVAPRAFPATNGGASGFVLGDVNGDGKKDLLTANRNSNDVSILLATGGGAFAPPSAVAVGKTPVSIALGDFNADGRNDLAVTNNGDQTLSVLLGSGGGAFAAPVTYPLPGASPGSVNVGDFNGDGHLDLAVVYGNSPFVSVMSGDGAGGFSAPTNYNLPSSSRGFVAADLNHDAKTDLAIVSPFNNSVAVLLSTGGSFSAAVSYPLNTFGGQPASIAAGDFNGDGADDLVVGGGSFDVSVLLNKGSGDFAPGKLVLTNSSDPTYVAVGDFNADGMADIATSGVNSIGLLYGDGAGGFSTPVVLNSAASGVNLTAGDVDGDGHADLLTLNNTMTSVVVLLNNYDPPPIFKFLSQTFSAGEGDGAATITVVRAGNVVAPASVTVATVDDPSPIRCDVINGKAYARCDYATTVEVLNFAPHETQKTFVIPLIDDQYNEGPEAVQLRLGDSPDGATCTPTTATLTIRDNDTGPIPALNPILASDFFVRMQYLDFLSREPEAGQPWTALLNGCPDPFNSDPASASATCDRVSVSSAFFRSQEFQLKGFFVYRFYKLSFGRLPTYAEIIPDMRSVTGTTTAEVRAKKAAFAAAWVGRQEFKNTYDSLSNQQFVDVLLNRYSLQRISAPDPSTPDDATSKITLTRLDLVNRLNANALTRAQVVRAVADSDEVAAAEFNSAFVAMQYFGYLRRDPETQGYKDWLAFLEAHPADFRTMVSGFVNSAEYRLRFGPQ